MLLSCHNSQKNSSFSGVDDKIRLITLAPGHFHAALIQKNPLEQIDPNVFVYAPEGKELDAHLALINSYNTRSENPAHWNEIVYTGPDFLEKMLTEKKGNIVMLAGNNQQKTNYLLQSVKAGLHVLADKPMAIDGSSFLMLEKAYANARQKGVLIYDMMTERYVDYNIVSRLLMQEEALFGELQKGTPDDPAVSFMSIHHFYKEVSGKPLIRPAWYYDVRQQGEGITDVTTHLIDLAHWKCFPDIPIDFRKDIQLTDASHWPTGLTKYDFCRSTQLSDFPSYLTVDPDSLLRVYANGTIRYVVKDIHVEISVSWNVEAPENAGDIHKSVIKGTKATLFVLQGEEQGYKPKLYIKKNEQMNDDTFLFCLEEAIEKLKPDYIVEVIDTYDNMKELAIHPKIKSTHEDHFSFVADQFFEYFKEGNMPDWEIANTLSKYYVTTTALEMARRKDNKN